MTTPAILRVRPLTRSPGKLTTDGFELNPRWLVIFDQIVDEATALWLCLNDSENRFPKPGLHVIGNALCNGLNADPVKESARAWIINADFNSKGGNNRSNDPTAPTLAPLSPTTPPVPGTINEADWQITMTRSPRSIGRPANKAYYLGGYKSAGKADTILSTDPQYKKPLVNSAGQYLADAPEDFYYQSLYSLRFYTSVVNESVFDYEGSLNDRDLSFHLRSFDVDWPKHTVRFEGATLAEVSRGDTTRWEVAIDVLYDRRTFTYDLADRGTMQRSLPGDTDGYGQTIPSGFLGLTLSPILQDDRVVTEPVYLDGDGRPLPATKAYDPFYGHWRNEDELDWRSCPYLNQLVL